MYSGSIEEIGTGREQIIDTAAALIQFILASPR